MGRGAWQNLILRIGNIYRFHPCNDILKRLYEVFEKSKKQDLTPKRLIEKSRVGNIEEP